MKTLAKLLNERLTSGDNKGISIESFSNLIEEFEALCYLIENYKHSLFQMDSFLTQIEKLSSLTTNILGNYHLARRLKELKEY